MRRSPADSTNRSLAAFGKLQHIPTNTVGAISPPPAPPDRGVTDLAMGKAVSDVSPRVISLGGYVLTMGTDASVPRVNVPYSPRGTGLPVTSIQSSRDPPPDPWPAPLIMSVNPTSSTLLRSG